MAFKDFFKIQKQGLEGMASVGVIGMHMVSGPLVGVAIGYGIDRFFDTHPWGKIVFLFIGIGAGFLNVWMDTKRLIGQLNKNQGVRSGTGDQDRQVCKADAPADNQPEPIRRSRLGLETEHACANGKDACSMDASGMDASGKNARPTKARGGNAGERGGDHGTV